ncbi:MAG TPA: hypothetical protein PLD88_06250, partial [Candidatus Berkiella sp.]|nr:hypothetical protein [Candidatus Berkiella sp.]
MDALSLLIHQHPSLDKAIVFEWQNHFQALFPHAKVNYQSHEQGFILNLVVQPYCFKVKLPSDG